MTDKLDSPDGRKMIRDATQTSPNSNSSVSPERRLIKKYSPVLRPSPKKVIQAQQENATDEDSKLDKSKQTYHEDEAKKQENVDTVPLQNKTDTTDQVSKPDGDLKDNLDIESTSSPEVIANCLVDTKSQIETAIPLKKTEVSHPSADSGEESIAAELDLLRTETVNLEPKETQEKNTKTISILSEESPETHKHLQSKATGKSAEPRPISNKVSHPAASPDVSMMPKDVSGTMSRKDEFDPCAPKSQTSVTAVDQGADTRSQETQDDMIRNQAGFKDNKEKRPEENLAVIANSDAEQKAVDEPSQVEPEILEAIGSLENVSQEMTDSEFDSNWQHSDPILESGDDSPKTPILGETAQLVTCIYVYIQQL